MLCGIRVFSEESREGDPIRCLVSERNTYCRSLKLGRVLIAVGSLGVLLAWKPGRLGSDAYSTRGCGVLVFSKYFGCWVF